MLDVYFRQHLVLNGIESISRAGWFESSSMTRRDAKISLMEFRGEIIRHGLF